MTITDRPRHRSSDRPVLYSPVTLHPRRRGRRSLMLLVVLTAVAASVAVLRWVTDDSRRDYLGTGGWPAQGQGAYAIDGSTPHVSAGQTPAPIASLAKVMTAYLVLQAAPLSARQDGIGGTSLLVTPADVADTARRRARDESVVRLRAGEHLSERQALMALLLPSANNVAVLLTRYADVSVSAFVDRMNATARQLGMAHTTYTDPSGYDEGTVSTAADQLILAQVAGRNPTLAAMMATRAYRLPVAGVVHNTDVLLGRAGFVGMKTGSDDAAGGCFMFHARRGGHDLWGAVLGQPGRNLVLTGQYAARQLAESVLPA